jgi:hypothetical protein
MRRSVRLGLAGSIAQVFVGSRFTPLLTVGSVLVGLLAIIALPREEEPQIRVPVADIQIAMPGATALEVESRISSPIERLMCEIPGVEYVYSTSSGSAAWPTRGGKPSFGTVVASQRDRRARRYAPRLRLRFIARKGFDSLRWLLDQNELVAVRASSSI